jgi:acyl-CoA reductase-like NAD-dependent aldehyde dehydrogenase
VKTLEEWQKAAAAVDPPARAFIDGQPVDSNATYPNLNPATGETIVEVASGDAGDIDRAVAAARAAFEDERWSGLSPKERGRALIRLADLIEDHAEELQLLETLDIGKPIRYSNVVDVSQAELTYRWYGEAADKLYDEISPTGKDSLGLITREPVGVVGAVTPWNFPLMINAWKLAPALMAGNSVVLKPAEQSPLTALRVAALAIEAGIPDGVLNVVPGFGETAGRALGLHEDVDAITFTGSTDVARHFLRYAADSNLKRVSAETGGKTPNLVFSDAPDARYAMNAIGFSIFWNTGESCIAGSRLLVEQPLYDEVVDSVATTARSWAPGDPLDPATKAGPIVDENQLARVEHYIELGSSEGARLVTGGNRTLADTGGFFIEPTVFADVDNNMTIAREEIFGPVLSIIPFTDEDDAIRIANDTSYGLAAAVWTSDLARAHRVSRAIRAGTVWVNSFDQADITAPFGGFKASGFGGKDKSLYALDKYTNVKTTWINLGKGGIKPQ